ncbi:hypothetical protein [Nocardia sp. NPDC019395]|uniref:hypothetical protein n=1 Tax=Nocardia sp. NPDC019395 TaxID=3154686 RepID=UPI003411F212
MTHDRRMPDSVRATGYRTGRSTGPGSAPPITILGASRSGIGQTDPSTSIVAADGLLRSSRMGHRRRAGQIQDGTEITHTSAPEQHTDTIEKSGGAAQFMNAYNRDRAAAFG